MDDRIPSLPRLPPEFQKRCRVGPCGSNPRGLGQFGESSQWSQTEPFGYLTTARTAITSSCGSISAASSQQAHQCACDGPHAPTLVDIGSPSAAFMSSIPAIGQHALKTSSTCCRNNISSRSNSCSNCSYGAVHDGCDGPHCPHPLDHFELQHVLHNHCSQEQGSGFHQSFAGLKSPCSHEQARIPTGSHQALQGPQGQETEDIYGYLGVLVFHALVFHMYRSLWTSTPILPEYLPNIGKDNTYDSSLPKILPEYQYSKGSHTYYIVSHQYVFN